MKKIFICLLLVFGPRIQGFSQESLLWEISGKDLKKPSYIFGTIHAICEEDFPFSRTLLKEKLAGCGSLVLEVDEDKIPVQEKMGSSVMMGDTTLNDIVSASEYVRLQRFFTDSMNMDLEGYTRIKPLFLASFLVYKMLECKQEKIVSAESIIRGLINIEKTQVFELEGFVAQTAIISAIPYRTQAEALISLADSFTKDKQSFRELVRAYKEGNLGALEKQVSTSMDGAPDMEGILVIYRNQSWIPLIIQHMQKEASFVAVGAAHLPGPQGLLELLKKQGYTVVPVPGKK